MGISDYKQTRLRLRFILPNVILKQIAHIFGGYNVQEFSQISQNIAFQIRCTTWSIIR